MNLPPFVLSGKKNLQVNGLPVNQHIHVEPSYTRTEMFNEQRRGKRAVKVCDITKYLNIRSVLYRQTQNTVYYIECFALRKHSPCWCWQSIEWWSAQEETPDLVPTVREDETLIATEFSKITVLQLLNLIYHLCGSDIQIQTMFQLGSMLIINAQLELKHSDTKNIDIVKMHFQICESESCCLIFNTSHYVSDFVSDHEELYL